MTAPAWLDPAITALGYAGAGLIALAYLLNQRGSLPSDNWRFPAVNLCGSLLVLGSLVTQPNTPSIAIELFWSAISVYGIVRRFRSRRLTAAPPAADKPAP